MSADDKLIENMGRLTAERGLSAAVCPYTFINGPYWQTKDYDGFNLNDRPKMNAWMKGWFERREELKKASRGDNGEK